MTQERRTGLGKAPDAGDGFEPRAERTQFSAGELVDFLVCPACSHWRSQKPERQVVLNVDEAQIGFLREVADSVHSKFTKDGLNYRQPKDLVAFARNHSTSDLSNKDRLTAELLVYYFDHWAEIRTLSDYWAGQEHHACFGDGGRRFYVATRFDQVRRLEAKKDKLWLWKLGRGLTEENFPLAVFEAGLQVSACAKAFDPRGEPSMSGIVLYDFQNGSRQRCNGGGSQLMLEQAALAVIRAINSGYSWANPNHDHICPSLHNGPQGRMEPLPGVTASDEAEQRILYQEALKSARSFARSCLFNPPKTFGHSIVEDGQGIRVQLGVHRVGGCTGYLSCNARDGIVSCSDHGEIDWLEFSKKSLQ